MGAKRVVGRQRAGNKIRTFGFDAGIEVLAPINRRP
jgi:hypothetical protein